jgi:hypothetical protein
MSYLQAPGFSASWDWTRPYMPEVRRILGENLIQDAPIYADRNENCDLVIPSVSVSVRLRHKKYVYRYSQEITLRCTRPHNISELDKLLMGYGNVIFYGFTEDDSFSLCAWLIGDLQILRAWLLQQLRTTGELPGLVVANKDGSSHFRAFNLASLPAEFIIARKPFLD